MRYVNPWPQPIQKPHPPIWIPGSLSTDTMYQVARRGFCYFISTRAHLSHTKMAARRFGEIVEECGQKFHPKRMGLLLSVYVAETDEIARRECEEGVYYFLRNCLKGHLRRAGRMLTFAPGAQTPQSWQSYLERSDATSPLLGDANSWEEIEQMGSIIVGSAETVRQRLWEYIHEARIGNMLIQFQIGNLSKELTLKSQRIFAEQVMPRLRADAAEFYAREFPESEALAATAPRA
jgi:alkanesulfonate monooxygenase SsuD/methylene tetrahydromethanopterin reductase-like flavin-dependent oxidoreductase (luciferase family)